MKRFFVANGDADGLCALHQLRLAEGGGAELITGVKRDIALLEQAHAQGGDHVTVCDISLETNRAALLQLLERGVRVRYFDHHLCSSIPEHACLEAHIETRAGVCTSLLVDRYLDGRYRAWAVAAAFGDNMDDTARELAEPLRLSDADLNALRELGESMNYNAYGESIADLVAPPAELYRLIAPYRDPLCCLAKEPVFAILRNSLHDDLARARQVAPQLDEDACTAHVLPNSGWSRRVNGVFANDLALADPDRAHAVLAPSASGGYIASVRAPGGHPLGAAAFCSAFPTGGGRHQAAGINRLAPEALPAFLRQFESFFRSHGS